MKKRTAIELKLKRKALVEAGAYDGRFRTKVIRDKKKLEQLRKCRKFKQDDT